MSSNFLLKVVNQFLPNFFRQTAVDNFLWTFTSILLKNVFLFYRFIQLDSFYIFKFSLYFCIFVTIFNFINLCCCVFQARFGVRALLQRHPGGHQGTKSQRQLRRGVQNRGEHVGRARRRAQKRNYLEPRQRMVFNFCPFLRRCTRKRRSWPRRSTLRRWQLTGRLSCPR